MIFSGLKEISRVFHEHLFDFMRSSDGCIEVDGYKMIIEPLDQKFVEYEDGESPELVLKLSYFDDVDGDMRECVLAFITPEGLVVQTPSDLEMFTYYNIITEGLFMLSLPDLGKYNHIYKVMADKYAA